MLGISFISLKIELYMVLKVLRDLETEQIVRKNNFRHILWKHENLPPLR